MRVVDVCTLYWNSSSLFSFSISDLVVSEVFELVHIFAGIFVFFLKYSIFFLESFCFVGIHDQCFDFLW